MARKKRKEGKRQRSEELDQLARQAYALLESQECDTIKDACERIGLQPGAYYKRRNDGVLDKRAPADIAVPPAPDTPDRYIASLERQNETLRMTIAALAKALIA